MNIVDENEFTFTNPMAVTFVLDFSSITVTVVDPDLDDIQYVVDCAALIVEDEIGFNPSSSANEIYVENKHGDRVEG